MPEKPYTVISISLPRDTVRVAARIATEEKCSRSQAICRACDSLLDRRLDPMQVGNLMTFYGVYEKKRSKKFGVTMDRDMNRQLRSYVSTLDPVVTRRITLSGIIRLALMAYKNP